MGFQDILKAVWESDILRLSLDGLLKLGLAALFGGFIGYEREQSHRPAGFRTHILVAVGSALVMLTSTYIFEMYKEQSNIDPARLGAQVISGIGFLGAGTILREGFSVKGLTTAASLWAVSCIGLAVGVGYYEGAIVATIVIYITLNMLKKFIIKGNAGKTLFIEVEELSSIAMDIGGIIHKSGASLHSLEILYADTDEDKRLKKTTVVLKALVFAKNERTLDLITDTIRSIEGVKDLYVV